MSQTWLDLNLMKRKRGTLLSSLPEFLDYIGKLDELNTEDVPPTSHIHPHQVFIMGSEAEASHVAKPDVVKPSYPREEVLANAPEAEEGYFGVPEWLTAATKWLSAIGKMALRLTSQSKLKGVHTLNTVRLNRKPLRNIMEQ